LRLESKESILVSPSCQNPDLLGWRAGN